MRNYLLKLLFFTTFIIFPGGVILAQTETDTTRSRAGATVENYLLAEFEIASPDSSFTPMRNGYGWEETATGSVVVCFPAPGSFTEMAESQIEKEQGSGGAVKIISKENTAWNGKPGVLVYGEIAENPDNPFCTVMYCTPLGENMVLMVNAIYPKSQHERLYPKMLTSFGSARLKQ